ncbi:MAG: NUDIX domain-containing protein [Candidatus Nanohalobium sp.]
MSQYPEPIAGVLPVNSGGEVFLMQSPKWEDKWTVPGGHVEIGETMKEAARRETEEEVGLELEDVRFLSVSEAVNPEEYEREAHHIYLNFLGYVDKPGEVELDQEEAVNYVWMKPEKALKNLDLNQGGEKFLREFIEEKPVF